MIRCESSLFDQIVFEICRVFRRIAKVYRGIFEIADADN